MPPLVKTQKPRGPTLPPGVILASNHLRIHPVRPQMSYLENLRSRRCSDSALGVSDPEGQALSGSSWARTWRHLSYNWSRQPCREMQGKPVPRAGEVSVLQVVSLSWPLLGVCSPGMWLVPPALGFMLPTHQGTSIRSVGSFTLNTSKLSGNLSSSMFMHWGMMVKDTTVFSPGVLSVTEKMS